MMLSLSPSRARARAPIVAAALAAGCLLSIISVSVHDSTTPATLLDPSEYSPRRLRAIPAWRVRRDRLRDAHNRRFHEGAAPSDAGGDDAPPTPLWVAWYEKQLCDKRARRDAHNLRFHEGAPPDAAGGAAPSDADCGDPPVHWWEDVLYGRDWACGRFKCFFRSAGDPRRGYLVADRKSQGSHSLKTYRYARDLEEEFGIRHFLLGPPYLSATRGYFVERLADTPREKLGDAENLVIQETIAAPKGSKVSKCRYFEKDVFDYFIEHGEEGWQRTLMEEMEVTKSLLDSHKELAHDWQIMIDLQGHVYHLDFDRTYRIIGSAEKARCVQDCLDEAIAYIGDSMNEEFQFASVDKDAPVDKLCVDG